MGGDLHPISARANSLELLDRISGAEFLIYASPELGGKRDVGFPDKQVE
jgi:hypothetical protein